MTIVYWCSIGYIIILLQTLIHEVAHFTIARILNIPIKKISVGWEKCSIKFRNLYLSPVLLGGYVEVFEKELQTKKSFEIVIFFEAGAIANFICSWLPMLFLKNIYSYAWLTLGILFALSANLPFESSDLYNIFSIIKKRKHNNEYMKW